jgi:hypothetical protein
VSDDRDRERVDVKASSVQRMWRAKLVELTKAPHPEIADGEATKMYIEPADVVCIERGVVRWELDDGAKTPSQQCTVITLTRCLAMVLEAPEEIARRVQVALRESS